MTMRQMREDFENTTCAVLGFGVSNRPLVELLLECGAKVTVRDGKAREALGEMADKMEARGVRFLTGAGHLDNLTEQYIFRSPGFRHDLPEISAAVANGSILTSEMEQFLKRTPATVIGVTGSDGKTTTTTLTGLLMERACKERDADAYSWAVISVRRSCRDWTK